MRPLLRLILWSGVLGVLLAPASLRMGPLPALGPLFDPVRGIWSVARSAELPDSAAASIPGLGRDVRVVYDDRRVPHVFASTTADAYRALGYVVARDRLFQMEMQTRATAGTLSEIAGELLLELDMEVRRLGLAAAAERDFARLAEEDPKLAEALVAYADGVNAFIDGLSPEERPFEYHLLGAEPARWRPVHTFYLLKRMGWILAFAPVELLKERVAARVGWEAADALLPADAPIREPIVPHEGAQWVGSDVPPPGASEPPVPMEPPPSARSPVVGSNNWAVGPFRSTSGAPILAGDPHLSLSLPSIWYEAHLVVPGELDVYGVTLAGVPGIVIGFNRDVAWSFTNTGADVMDYYRERVDDPDAPTRYFLDGAWEPLDVRVERFLGPGGELLAADTVRSTHRGPLLAANGDLMSLRWTVLEGQNELRSLMGAARAGSVDEWLDAMAGWHAPAQNGLVAGRNGSIAIQSAGWFPQRPEGVRGDVVQDGTTRNVDWLGRAARFPIARDPEQGYLASANQQPWDPDAEPAYLGADWPDPWRALTINELLRGGWAVDGNEQAADGNGRAANGAGRTVDGAGPAMERHSPANLEAYQTYPSSVRAHTFRAAFLAAAERTREGGRWTPALAEAVRLLEAWDGSYAPDDQRAVLFEAAMDALEDALWDELAVGGGTLVTAGSEASPDTGAASGDADSPRSDRTERLATPREQVLWSLLDQPDSPWWDDRTTPEVEDRDAILARAMISALERVEAEHGPPDGGGWAWRNFGRHNVYHLLQLPALSRLDLPTGGGPGLLNPMTGAGTHGASWRMVVEMGDNVSARGTFPGGQSGNPASPDYDDRLANWVAGELEDLRFPRNEAELVSAAQARAQLVLTPGMAPTSPPAPEPLAESAASPTGGPSR